MTEFTPARDSDVSAASSSTSSGTPTAASDAPLRLGVVGSGALAAVRTAVLSAHAGADVVAVAARSVASAQGLAGRHDAQAVGDYRRLEAMQLDAVLVAVPHRAQDEVVSWALGAGLHVLVGGPLASDLSTGRSIVSQVQSSGLVLEAGYEARYKHVWRTARRLLGDGGIGTPVSVRSSAAFDQVPDTWAYSQYASGGMLVTHLTYAFLNPLRWLLGMPVVHGAAGGAHRVLTPGAVWPETCVAAVQFDGGIPGSLYASYVAPKSLPDWSVTIVGTTGALHLQPGDQDGGHLVHHRDGHEPEQHRGVSDGFIGQAAAFLSAVTAARAGEPGAGAAVLNPAQDAVNDLEVCAAIEKALVGRPG